MIPASHAHVRVPVLLAIAGVMATLAAAPVHGQRVDESLPPLADLSIASEYNTQLSFQVQWNVTVKNNTVGAHPGTHVHLVKVRITISDAVRGATTQIWTIRGLPPGDSATRKVRSFRLTPGTTAGPEKVPQRLHAEIIGSDPVESPRFRSNNATEHWAIEHRRAVHRTRQGRQPVDGATRYANGDVAVDVASVSDREPPERGAATFTVAAYNNPKLLPGIGSAFQDVTQFEVQVEISLSPGLSFAATQQAPSSGTFDTSTGIWNIDTMERKLSEEALSLPVAVNLTTDSLSALPLEERCLTAKVVRAVPWFASDLSKRVNDIATACLGEALLSSGAIDLFTFYPCIGPTSYPCTNADTLELVVARSDGDDLLQPDSVIVHVPDPGGRRSRGGSVLWSTDGVMDLRLNATRLTSSWTIAEAVTVTAPGGGDAPGRWAIVSGGYDLLAAEDSSKVSYAAYSLSTLGTDPADYAYDVDIEFSTLGTYKALHEISGSLSGSDYSDSGTYTFHVGPVADLEVRDAGASPEAGGSQRAYTVMAVNNGPEFVAPGVEVTLSGVPQGVQAMPSQGRYVERDCQSGLCAGDWIIGELRLSDYYRASALSGPPTLTLVSARGGDLVTATIESTEDYCVRIKTGVGNIGPENDLDCAGNLPTGYTEHSAAYYDYRDDNDMITVAARAGTASEAGAAGQPRSLRVRQFGIIAILTWDAMYPREVNGFPVTHFHLERSGIIVENDLTESAYVDLQGDVNQSYRVRAVNEFGVPGPWSERAGAGIGELGAPYDLIVTPAQGEGRIDLQWRPSASDHVDYRIDHSDSGTDPWRVLAIVHDGTDYVHDGLAPQTTHYYRVAAVRDTLISAWVYAVETTQPDLDYVAPVDTVHTVPSEPRNLRFSRLDRTSVTLVWEPPADDGGARVTGYEYWVSGPCASDPNAICDVVPPTRVSGTSRAISGLTVVGGTYYFQVRAFNAAGAGAWTQGIAKTVGAEPQAPGGGRVVFTPSRVTVPEGGSVTYRVKLTSNPTQPLWVALYWDGDYDMGTELPGEQFKTLLPTGYDISSSLIAKHCPSVHGVYRWGEMAFPWNVGVPITVTALEDDDRENGRLIIEHDIFTVPKDCLDNPTNYDADPVYDGMYGIALEVTERDND